LPEWFDVDRGADAWRLLEHIRSGRIVAPASGRALARLEQTEYVKSGPR
jgi:hypothetical protein